MITTLLTLRQFFQGLNFFSWANKKVALAFLLFSFGALSAQAQSTTIYSVKNGNVESADTWNLKRIPRSNEVIVINHSVVLNQDFMLGEASRGEIKVAAAGSLTTGQNGRLRIRGNGSQVENFGTVNLKSLGLGSNGSDSAYFINHNVAILSDNPEMKIGALRNFGTLSFTSTNNIYLEKVTITNGQNATLSFANNLTLYSGSLLINRGNVLIKGRDAYALNINQGIVKNYGDLKVTGGLNITGAPTDKSNFNLSNYGTFSTNSVYLNNQTSVQNSGSMVCANNFISNQAIVINQTNGYLEQTNPNSVFENRNSGAMLTNNGFLKVKGDFTNIANAVLNGSGYIAIDGYSKNVDRAIIEGNLTIYDPSAYKTTILDQGFANGATIAPTVKAGTSSAPGCDKPVVAVTGPTQLCNVADEFYTFTVGQEAASTTYTYTLPEGFFIMEGEGTGTISVFIAVEEYLLNQSLPVKVTATNACGSTSAEMQVMVKDCALANPLPVTLTSFTATAKKGMIQLNWATASEKNNQEFVVERSADGKTFTAIKTVQGGGNSNVPLNYTFQDAQPLTGTSYYRLRQVDFDGTTEYSKVVSVKNQTTGTAAAIKTNAYPNPFQGVLTLELKVEKASEVKITLTNMAGQVVQQKTVQAEGTAAYTLDNLQNAPAGIYFLKVYQDGQVTTHKLLKNN
ncbi:T9SS type A sorting domain-containing protein [Rufibacter sediminis]|uniref:T9SS type A sorting domain-containing protein n=1 Tax=Rufibacter sediminis TaxID=2762756 RepID=A0ABR6VX00_9BACT|nr:T9SS type A sorting domain-containing protein [Rufibacter sediminis]MBC3541664.1 T9SS type A sorting domain-containing protein [Rufibacter sediminis]